MPNPRLALAYPRQWSPRIAPTWPVEVDRGHPLASGLIGLWLFSGGNPRNYAGTGGSTVSGNPTIVGTAFGPGTKLDTSNTQKIDTSLTLPALTQVTVSFLGIPTSNNFTGAGTNPRFCANAHTDGDNRGVQLALENQGGPFWFFDIGYISGTSRVQSANQTATAGTLYNVVGTYDTANLNLYVNGAVDATPVASASRTIAVPNTPIPVSWGYNPNYNGDYCCGTFISGAIWNRALSASEVAWLNAEPFSMLRPVTRRTFFVGGGGATNITISAATWHWTPAALAVNQRQQTAMALATWHWTPAALAVNQKQQVAISAVTWSWVPAALSVNAKTMLAVTKATWSWTAAALSINQRQMIAMTKATWAWTASALTVVVRQSLTIAAATWTWTARAFAGFGLSGGGVVFGVVRGVVRAVVRRVG